MAKTYQQLKREIVELQRRADAAREEELIGVIKEIKSVIAAWGLTVADLGLVQGRALANRNAAKKTVSRKVVKRLAVRGVAYRDEAGNTWGGRGRRPHWLRAALEAGRALNEFKA